MDPLPIIACDRGLSPGDLNTRLYPGRLEVPRELATMLAAQSIRTAPQMLSYGFSFPSALAQSLGWSPEDVLKAFRGLAEQLGSRIPEAKPGRFSFGARNPSELKR